MHTEDYFPDLFGLLCLIWVWTAGAADWNSKADAETAIKAAMAMSIILFIFIWFNLFSRG